MPDTLPIILDPDHAVWADYLTLCQFGGRLTGSPSEAAARDWAIERLNSIGAGRVSRHPTPYVGWQCFESRLELASGEVLDATPLLHSASTPADGLELDVVDCGRGTPEDILAAGPRLRGQAALVRHEFMLATNTVHRRVKLNAAIEAGAAAFLIAAPTLGLGPVTGSGVTRKGVSAIPALGISGEAAERIMTASCARVRIRLATALQPDAQTETIVLDLPGRDADYVVLSAHIDGHALGESALDNATGVAVALSLARAAAPYAKALPRGLKICLFSAEEWALSGSQAWLASLAEAEVRRMAFNLNLDTVTGGTRLTALTSGFTGLGRFVTNAANDVDIDLGIHVPIMVNSDHASFAALGIPALRLVSGFNEPTSKIRLLLTRHDRADLVAPEDFVKPTRVAWSILRTALTAPAEKLIELRSRQ